jgi:ferric-dicitrate binding protein FerR (iron transport regulator)
MSSVSGRNSDGARLGEIGASGVESGVILSRRAHSSVHFQDETLGNVAAELMRYTHLKIEFSDPALRQLRVGGTFRAGPEGADALLRLLRDGFAMTIRHEGPGRVCISR